MPLPRLHVIDGTYELYRAHFSKRPSHEAKIDGRARDVKASLGVVSSLLHLLTNKEEAVTHLAVAFDNPIRCYRNELFDGYKTDEGVPPELRIQFDWVEEAVRALGVVVWSMDRFEADDALATATVKYRSEFSQIRIMTPDKDLGQCVVGEKVVQVDRMREKVLNEDAVVAKMGVPPSSIPDLLALVGDSADGIPGLAGFGAKSAAKLLTEYRTIEQIPSDYTQWKVKIVGAERLSGVLEAERNEALLYKKLATLTTDVPLPQSAGDLVYRGASPDAWKAMCERFEAPRMLERAPKMEMKM